MSSGNPSGKRRSFRVIGKIFKFGLLLALTFIGSFAATLMMKSDNPLELFGTVSEEFVYDDEPVNSTGATKIKTLFDDVNADDKNSSDAKKISDGKNSSAEKNSSPDESVDEPRREESIGFFAGIKRMANIKPAVDKKISDIPHYVTLPQMPHLLRRAIVAVEDTRFYKHRGFDIIGIARAVFVNVEAGEIREGASTITQQTVKNLFLTSDRTFARKFEELVLSMNMERNFDKDKILEIYLNTIYFGSNFYGIYDAAHGYFGKDPVDLTIGECAMLAGLPNAPSLYSPYVNFHKAKTRQLVVIDAMEEQGIITKTEAESARVEEIVLVRE